MAFIKTDKGNLIPYANIKVIIPSGEDTKLVLRDGSMIVITKPFDAVTSPVDINDLVGTMFATVQATVQRELQKLRDQIDELVDSSKDSRHKIANATTRLESTVSMVIPRMKDAAESIESTSTKIAKQSKAMDVALAEVIGDVSQKEDN